MYSLQAPAAGKLFGNFHGRIRHFYKIFKSQTKDTFHNTQAKTQHVEDTLEVKTWPYRLKEIKMVDVSEKESTKGRMHHFTSVWIDQPGNLSQDWLKLLMWQFWLVNFHINSTVLSLTYLDERYWHPHASQESCLVQKLTCQILNDVIEVSSMMWRHSIVPWLYIGLRLLSSFHTLFRSFVPCETQNIPNKNIKKI